MQKFPSLKVDLVIFMKDSSFLKNFFNSLFLLVVLLVYNFLVFDLKAQEPSNKEQKQQSSQINEQDTISKFPSLNETLEQERLSSLTELKTKLEQIKKRNRADLFLIFNEKFFNSLLAELTKTKFNAGNFFEITVEKSKMTFLNGIALAQIQAKLTSTNSLLDLTTLLNVTAKLFIEQDEKNSLVAKFQIIDVKSANSESTLAPPVSAEQLGKLLPPVTLPLELDFDRTFQPDKFSQTKPVAYEVTSEARRIKGHFKIIDLLPLSGRLVLLAKVQDLSITQGQVRGKKRNQNATSNDAPNPTPINFFTYQEKSLAQLDSQINELSANLISKTDFSIIVQRYFLDLLADQLAQSSTRDLIIKVMRSRVMSSKSDLGFAKYENYLDIENGDGFLDLKDAEVQSLRDGQISLFLDAVGQIQAQAKGKQIGFEYDANPQIGVSLRDNITFVFEQIGQDFQIKPVSKKISVHLDIKVPVQMIGKDVNTSQNVSVDTATIIKPIILPKVIDTNLSLPQGNKTITLTDVNYKTENEQLIFGANLNFSQPKEGKKVEESKE